MARRDDRAEGIGGILRHRHSQEYYKGDGHWTSDLTEARFFASFSDVVAEADKYQIKDCCEFVVQFGERKDMSLFLPL